MGSSASTLTGANFKRLNNKTKFVMTYLPRQLEVERYVFYDKATVDRLLTANFYPMTIWFYEIDIPDDANVRINSAKFPLEYTSDNVIIYESFSFTYKPQETEQIDEKIETG